MNWQTIKWIYLLMLLPNGEINDINNIIAVPFGDNTWGFYDRRLVNRNRRIDSFMPLQQYIDFVDDD